MSLPRKQEIFQEEIMARTKARTFMKLHARTRTNRRGRHNANAVT